MPNAAPETLYIASRQIACDGDGDLPNSPLGHPRVFLTMDARDYVDCGYCDRHFVLSGGAADTRATAS